jgi:hypothetical protein
MPGEWNWRDSEATVLCSGRICMRCERGKRKRSKAVNRVSFEASKWLLPFDVSPLLPTGLSSVFNLARFLPPFREWRRLKFHVAISCKLRLHATSFHGFTLCPYSGPRGAFN